ncbi:hypothetical protein [Jannaschia pohangensis]|uniref:Uncharacterized protein n=1 Tax=Jannaschia pohangensis TaxID=390807 RepID=A0A1I3J1P7_9RHOB|nr:hypothetical protein [Jannaschia pohangensis]SFI54120.1 hypothetical protein SAMN04488095_1176 [Jannaschia pohangensis]
MDDLAARLEAQALEHDVPYMMLAEAVAPCVLHIGEDGPALSKRDRAQTIADLNKSLARITDGEFRAMVAASRWKGEEAINRVSDLMGAVEDLVALLAITKAPRQRPKAREADLARQLLALWCELDREPAFTWPDVHEPGGPFARFIYGVTLTVFGHSAAGSAREQLRLLLANKPI